MNPSYHFISTFFALTFSLLLVGTVFKLWFEYDAQLLKDQIEAESAALQLQLQKQSQQQAIQQSKLQFEQRRAAEIRIQKQRTCDFWKKQYKKTRSRSDKVMLDSACSF